jgi:hypothetical protein
MFASGFICWIGAFGLAAGAFGQTYVPVGSQNRIRLPQPYISLQNLARCG